MSLISLSHLGAGSHSNSSSKFDILFWKTSEYLVFFLSIWTTLAVMLGYFGIVSIFTFFIALFFTFGFFHFFGKKISSVEYPINAKGIIVACTGIFLFYFIIYLFYHGGYDLSADVAPSFAANLIHEQQKIPSTYLPYFDIPFLYHIGLVAVVASLPLDIIPAHIWMIIFGILGYCLTIAYLTRIGHALIKNDLVIWVIPAFVVAVRMLPTHLLTGEYPLMLSIGIGLASLTFFNKNSILASFIFGTVFLLHPLGGIITGLFWVLSGYHLSIKNLIYAAVISIVLFIPTFFAQWLPYFALPRSPYTIGRLPLATDIYSIIILAGWGLFLLLIIGAFFYSRKKSLFTDVKLVNRFLLVILGGCAFYFTGQFFPDFVLTHKAILLIAFGVILLAAHYWSEILNHKNAPYFFVLFLLCGLLFMSSSSYLKPFIKGSKANFEEAHYSTTISSMVRGTKTLFLSAGQGKMAQYSGAFPYDSTSNHFTTSTLWKSLQTDGSRKMVSDSNYFRFVYNTKCLNCIDDMDPDYVVVNVKKFPKLTSLEWVILEEKPPFILYRRK